ncbi:MAG: hypothetical protein AB8U66_05195 [Rickettsiales endosymbiont of Dermacentor nuttalli]
MNSLLQIMHYLEKIVKKIYNQMLVHFNNQNDGNVENDAYKEISDDMSDALIKGIAVLPESIRAEFNAHKNFNAKLTYYEKRP